MNNTRIQREVVDALQTFAYVELHPTGDGRVYVKAALQAPSQLYVISIRFPDSYPNEMPRVYIDAPKIGAAPHQYQTGNICYMHPSMWNPGSHNLSFVIARAAKWLTKYEIWKSRGKWPGAQIKH